MNLMPYLVESTVCSAIFAAYYLCVLRNGHFYSWNRFYLLLSAAISLIIPLIHIHIHIPAPELFPVPYREEIAGSAALIPVEKDLNIGFSGLLLALYGVPLLCLAVFELRSLWKINRLKKGKLPQKINGVKVYIVDSHSAPFSFFNTVFWRKEININSSGGQRILRHEILHVKAFHSYDKLFMQLLCTVFWINPVFWLLKRELGMVHEYAADSASIDGNDTQKLSELILRSIYPNHYMEFINKFFQSNIIKRRLVMLSKKQKFSLLRRLTAIPLVLLTIAAFVVSIEAKPAPGKKDVVPYETVAVKPLFDNENGKDGFIKWIFLRLEYPQNALEQGTGGNVTVSFTIDNDGSVKDIAVMNQANSVLSKAVIEWAGKSPKWTPGKDAGGNIVPVSFSFSVVFKIDGNNKNIRIFYGEVETMYANIKLESGEEVISYANMEEKPMFCGENAGAFVRWVYSQLNYPPEAMEKNISGTVRIGFIINEDGSLSNIQSLKEVDSLLENAVMDIVRKSPKWTPGKYRNKLMKTSYQIPVIFKLQQ
jgi:TonB family protein